MNNCNSHYKQLYVAICLVTGLLLTGAGKTFADDADDAVVNIWVDNANLNLFIQQLASISGRTPQIEGVLPGIISGRFSGSVEETLNDLSDNYPVLFDVEEDVLRAVDKSALSNVSIAMTDASLADGFKSQLDRGLLPGNSIEFGEGAIRVSGHPSFVKRSASLITAELADSEARANQAIVVDKGSEQMIKDITSSKQTEQKVVGANDGPRPILSVDDIPGFNTF
ncbi:MAG: hypothetical protein AB8B79_00740 [Granulosicoccus sp.]